MNRDRIGLKMLYPSDLEPSLHMGKEPVVSMSAPKCSSCFIFEDFGDFDNVNIDGFLHRLNDPSFLSNNDQNVTCFCCLYVVFGIC